MVMQIIKVLIILVASLAALSCVADADRNYLTSDLSIAQEQTPFKIILPDINAADKFIAFDRNLQYRHLEWDVTFTGAIKTDVNSDKNVWLSINYSTYEISPAGQVLIDVTPYSGWRFRYDAIVEDLDGILVGSSPTSKGWQYTLNCAGLTFHFVVIDIPRQAGLALAESLAPKCNTSPQ